MEAIVRVTDKKLARDPQWVFEAVRRGTTALVERTGEPTVAIVDIVDIIDYRVLRAVARSRIDPIGVVASESGLPDEVVAQEADAQARYDLVLAYYLAEEFSLGRGAELLDVPWAELRERLHR